MDYSCRIRLSWACSGCGQRVHEQVYAVIDAWSRPDLLSAALKDDATTCPSCGTIQSKNLPLMVYNATSYPQVFFFYPENTTVGQDEEVQRAYMKMLTSRMGPVSDEAAEAGGVASFPREVMPVLLRPLVGPVSPGSEGEDDEEVYVRFEGTLTPKISGRKPPAEVVEALEQITQVALNVRLGRSRSDEPLARTVVRLAKAGLQALGDHGDPFWRAMLRIELAKGLAASSEENWLVNVEQAIGELHRAAQELPRDGEPQLRSMITFELGRIYHQRPIGDPRENSRLAAAYLRTAVKDTQDAPDRALWTSAQAALGGLLVERGTQTDPLEIEEGIRLLEEVVASTGACQAQEAWCDSVSHLAAGYGLRPYGDRAVNLERALELYERLDTGESRERDPEQWANTQVRRAILQMKRLRGVPDDNRRQAQELMLAALEIYEQVGDRQEASSTRDKLAILHWELGEFDQALRWLKESLAGRPREAVPTLWVRSRMKLGELLLAHPEVDPSAAADEVRRRALSILEEAVAQSATVEGHSEYGFHSLSLGRAYRRYRRSAGCGDPDLLDREIAALQVAVANLRHRPDAFGWASAALGAAYADANDWTLAAPALEAAVAAEEERYRACLVRTSRREHLAAVRGLHSKAAFALAQAGRPADAVLCLERGRARAFGEVLSPDRDQLRSLTDIDAEACAGYVRAADKLGALHSHSWELSRPQPGPPDPSAERAIEAQESVLAGSIDAARSELRAAIARVRALPGMETFLGDVSLAAVTDAIQAGEVICYLATTPWGSLALLVCKDRPPEVAWAELTVREAIDTALALADIRNGHPLPELLLRLGERLMGGVAERLPADAAVVLIPCGALAHLPLHAATVGTMLPLLAEHECTYSPSVRMLLAARARKNVPSAPVRLLAAAGATSDLLTGEEVDLVAAAFESVGRQQSVAPEPTAFLEGLPAATHVHLAGHGSFNSHDPLASAIQVGGGRITLAEILDTRSRPLWGAQLITLSACDSAVVDRALPDEGIGLPAGLLLAGGAGVVCTQWETRDIPAMLLMVRLYRLLLGADGQAPSASARALNEAQRWLASVARQTLLDLPWLPEAARRQLAGDRVPATPFAHPYFWAPYILVGA